MRTSGTGGIRPFESPDGEPDKGGMTDGIIRLMAITKITKADTEAK